MRTLRCRYYEHVDTVRWCGFVEPPSRLWVGFLGPDGKLRIFYRRDRETGAVPLELPAT